MIETEEWYSVQQIQEQMFLPMAKTAFKIKKFIKEGMLKAKIMGEGRSRRYYVKGAWLEEFIRRYEK